MVVKHVKTYISIILQLLLEFFEIVRVVELKFTAELIFELWSVLYIYSNGVDPIILTIEFGAKYYFYLYFITVKVTE